jgi:hypothetical protein
MTLTLAARLASGHHLTMRERNEAAVALMRLARIEKGALELARETGLPAAVVVERALAVVGAARVFSLRFHGVQEHPVRTMEEE